MDGCGRTKSCARPSGRSRAACVAESSGGSNRGSNALETRGPGRLETCETPAHRPERPVRQPGFDSTGIEPRIGRRIRRLPSSVPVSEPQFGPSTDVCSCSWRFVVELGGIEPRRCKGRESPGHSVFEPANLAGGSYRGSYRPRRVPRCGCDVGHGRQWTPMDDGGRTALVSLAGASSIDVHRRPTVQRSCATTAALGRTGPSWSPTEAPIHVVDIGHAALRSTRRRSWALAATTMVEALMRMAPIAGARTMLHRHGHRP